MIDAIVWAGDQKCPSPIAKLLLLKLCDDAGHECECWPLKPTVAEFCGLSPEEVIQYLEELIDARLISWSMTEGDTRYFLPIGRQS